MKRYEKEQEENDPRRGAFLLRTQRPRERRVPQVDQDGLRHDPADRPLAVRGVEAPAREPAVLQRGNGSHYASRFLKGRVLGSK